MTGDLSSLVVVSILTMSTRDVNPDNHQQSVSYQMVKHVCAMWLSNFLLFISFMVRFHSICLYIVGEAHKFTS